MTANTFGRQVVLPLTNKSGGAVVAGDVVIVDTTTAGSFTTTTSAASTALVGIAQESIANNAVGRVLLSGYAALVNVNASVTLGHYGATHTVAKQAASAGAARGAGTFCQFLSGGTTPDAMVWATDMGAGSGIAASLADAAGDMLVATAADTWAKQVNNLAASAAPAVTDDSGDGYSIGSRWINTTADKEYVATDVSVGAAVWKETTGGGMTTYSAVPAANVTLTRSVSTFIAICSVSLPAGTYMAWAQINAAASTAAVYSELRISDGAGTVLSSAEAVIGGAHGVYYLQAVPFVLASTKTLTLEGHGRNGQESDPIAYKNTPDDGNILATSLMVMRLA